MNSKVNGEARREQWGVRLGTGGRKREWNGGGGKGQQGGKGAVL